MKIDDLKNGSRVYIAGPMTGRRCFNFEQFFFWALTIRDRGMIPVNPAENDCMRMLNGWQYTKDKYPDVLQEDIGLIRGCDAIFLLNGWEESPGAKAEKAFADAIGLHVIEQPKENSDG